MGALLSAFLLGVVLTTFSEYVGMPHEILLLLSGIALALTGFSLGCYFFARKSWQPLLLAIGATNLLYCCLTIALVVYYSSQLTFFGFSYFVVEVLIIGVLASLELSVCRLGA